MFETARTSSSRDGCGVGNSSHCRPDIYLKIRNLRLESQNKGWWTAQDSLHFLVLSAGAYLFGVWNNRNQMSNLIRMSYIGSIDVRTMPRGRAGQMAATTGG